jgi:hypothetical protein
MASPAQHFAVRGPEPENGLRTSNDQPAQPKTGENGLPCYWPAFSDVSFLRKPGLITGLNWILL